MKEKDLRVAIIAQCRAMNASGINQGASGNISARLGEAMLITPSAIPYSDMRPEMLALMPLGGEYGAWSGRYKPSTEWRFHLDIMRARPDVGAIVHCHPIYATALSMLHKPIAAAHYMIAIFGGPSVRCTPYAPYGTKELADLAVAGLEGRNGVLLGNHGMIATGATLAEAMWRAGELETLAKLYYLALAAGRPVVLSDDEVMRIVERFKTYGRGPESEIKTRAQPKKARAKKKTAATKTKSASPKRGPKKKTGANARRR
ncbi:class II aldolase/adducin family protein [Methylocapsa sp. S129]|uniref:class II aldolase/adducin family protein n=1 Tax=Methylocapsa sp. S129 TaxID=1641869 RepID=UPI00131BE33B|nr:class II aldolase/adducin family protein [Methylocapsa sp. S129]